MSAYKLLKVDLVSKTILLEALKKMGLHPQVHENPKALRGYENKERTEKAEIIVPKEQLNARFTGISNDMGFHWSEDGGQWNMICSDYDVRMHMVERVVQAYAAVALAEQMAENRCTVEFEGEDVLKHRKRDEVVVIGRLYI